MASSPHDSKGEEAIIETPDDDQSRRSDSRIG